MGNFNPAAVVSVHPTSIDRPVAGRCHPTAYLQHEVLSICKNNGISTICLQSDRSLTSTHP